MIEAEVGVPSPLELMLPDGNSTRAVRVYLQKADGTDLGTVDLPHMARGRYAGLHTFTEAGFVYTDYITFSDATFAFEDLLYTRRSEVYKISPPIDLAASFAAIPQAVWGFPIRLVTNDFSDFATKEEVAALQLLASGLAKTTYINKMSTTFNTVTGNQEVIVWAEKDGNVVAGGACSVAVKNPAGSAIWSASLPSGNADGVYHYLNPISALGDQNFYIVIGIVVDGFLRVNLQPFFTIA